MGVYLFGPFQLDAQRLLLIYDGTPLALGPKVVETLLALVERPGDILSKAELLDRIWPEGFVEEANLAQNIYVIRKALRTRWESEAIVTVPRRGYRFAAPVINHDGASVPLLVTSVPAAPIAARRFPLRRYASAAVAACLMLTVVGSTISNARNAGVALAQPLLSVQGARYYAMGRYYWNQRTRSSMQKAVRYFGEVVKSDPNDARGYAALAGTDAIIGEYHYGPQRSRVYYTRAKAYASKALALNPHCAEAHAALGVVDDATRKRGAAEAEYRRAIALDPSYAPAHQWYGTDLLIDGKDALAYTELQRAADLDPLSVTALSWLSTAAYFVRHYGEAVNYAHQALDLSPQHLAVYPSMGVAYEAAGDYRDAIASYRAYEKHCRHCQAEAAALLAHVYAEMHRYSEASAELQIAQAGIAQRRVDPEDVVVAFIALGRRDDALALLGHMARTAENSAIIAIDPRMDPVRNDVRFKAWTQGPA